MTWIAAGVAGGSALLGSGLSFLGASNSARQTRAAMQRYLDELNTQRQTFLDQPESRELRRRLGEYATGNVGYGSDTLKDMKATVYEDYGKGMSDMTRMVSKGGSGASGVFTPGRASRTARLASQNIAANRANSIRDVNKANADVALSNQRFAASALPTYMPGTPSTTVASPDVYLKSMESPDWASFLGQGLTQAGQIAGQMAMLNQLQMSNPIVQRMMGVLPYDSVTGAGPNPNFVPGYGAGSSFDSYYRNLSPTR